jgi:uncharacterized protein (TIGR02996 family)
MNIQEETGFIQALMSDRSDKTAKLVFADWLEEHGDRRAEMLRIMVQGSEAMSKDAAQALVSENNPLADELTKRLGTIIGDDKVRICLNYSGTKKQDQYNVVCSIAVGADTFARHGATIMRFLPVDNISINGVSNQNIAGCFGHEELALRE